MPAFFWFKELAMADPMIGDIVDYTDVDGKTQEATVVGFTPFTLDLRLEDESVVTGVPHGPVGYWTEPPPPPEGTPAGTRRTHAHAGKHSTGHASHSAPSHASSHSDKG
jgi:hypothetical protein